MNKKGFISPHISLLILVSVLVGAGVYFYTTGSLTNVLSAKDIRAGRLAQNSLVAVPSTQTFIEIQAWGTMIGSEPPKIALDIKGDQAMYTFVSDRSTSYNYTYKGAPLRPEDIRVRFMNDQTDPVTRLSRDVKIDYIKLNGVKYESEHPSVLSTGTWTKGVKCDKGYIQSDWLHCNGYFQYASIASEHPDIDYTRLNDGVTLNRQTFLESDARYEGKYAKGYVFKVKKNTPYSINIVDYYDDYGDKEYITTYLFDANKNLITKAQTNLPIREGDADTRVVYKGIHPAYEGDIYVIVTNGMNDVRSFDILAFNTLSRQPNIIVRDTELNKRYNMSALTAFNKNYTLPIQRGSIILDLKWDESALADPEFDLKVYTLEGTYFDHIQKFIEDGSFDYLDAKVVGREIPVSVVRTGPSTLEIYAKQDGRNFASPFGFSHESQIQVVYEFNPSPTSEADRSMTFWTSKAQ